jgi:N-acetylneuraminic acid mutarotase
MASVLTNGQILVSGGRAGTYLNSAELYNPSTGVWTVTGSMNHARQSHMSSILTNGQILVSGGWNGSCLNSAELYNPSTGVWTVTGSMNYTRYLHTAPVLTNGQVLVSGGYSSSSSSAYLDTAELYNPSTGVWTLTVSMNYARYYQTASVLTNGQVLVTGGYNANSGSLYYAELYQP